jgi:hypothetical protein
MQFVAKAIRSLTPPEANFVLSQINHAAELCVVDATSRSAADVRGVDPVYTIDAARTSKCLHTVITIVLQMPYQADSGRARRSVAAPRMRVVGITISRCASGSVTRTEAEGPMNVRFSNDVLDSLLHNHVPENHSKPPVGAAGIPLTAEEALAGGAAHHTNVSDGPLCTGGKTSRMLQVDLVCRAQLDGVFRFPSTPAGQPAGQPRHKWYPGAALFAYVLAQQQRVPLDVDEPARGARFLSAMLLATFVGDAEEYKTVQLYRRFGFRSSQMTVIADGETVQDTYSMTLYNNLGVRALLRAYLYELGRRLVGLRALRDETQRGGSADGMSMALLKRTQETAQRNTMAWIGELPAFSMDETAVAARKQFMALLRKVVTTAVDAKFGAQGSADNSAARRRLCMLLVKNLRNITGDMSRITYASAYDPCFSLLTDAQAKGLLE